MKKKPSVSSAPPSSPAREISPEEARARRRQFLAQARQWEAEARAVRQESGEDPGDATTATFILPGD